MDSINREWYSRPGAVAPFARDDRLEPALVVLLVRYRDQILRRDVLDIGVGAGRTTLYLRPLTPGYIGIDYSPSMVAHSSARFPEARIELGDARDLSRFAAESFDSVLFSYMGIDAVDHEGRLRILSEVARVLRPGGVFIFSVHNRDYVGAHDGPRLVFSRNPLTQLANIGRWLRLLWIHHHMRQREQSNEEYALVNDVAEEYSLIHYYIDAERQRAQLESAGLSVLEVLDDQGRAVEQGATPTRAPWLWFVAQRATVASGVEDSGGSSIEPEPWRLAGK